MEPRCCIHIGLPKTATKTLQEHFFALHSRILYLGTFVGRKSKPYWRFDRCRNESIQAVMNEIAWGNSIAHPDIKICREHFAKSIAPHAKAGLVPVWSWESLSTDTFSQRKKRAENLREVFGECKIIMTIREPVDLLESAYFQLLRRESINRDFVMNIRGKYSCYFTVEEWLEKSFHGEIMPHLKYEKTIELYSHIFGKNSIKILLFEDLKNDFPGYLKSMCEFMGIDHQEAIRLTEGKKENSRWTQKQISVLKLIDRTPMKYPFSRFTNYRMRRFALETLFGKPKDKKSRARARIPGKWRERIADVTREGNQKLVRDWDLPLDRYGYPL